MNWGFWRLHRVGETRIWRAGFYKTGANPKCSTCPLQAFMTICAMKSHYLLFLQALWQKQISVGALHPPTASECPDQPPPPELGAAPQARPKPCPKSALPWWPDWPSCTHLGTGLQAEPGTCHCLPLQPCCLGAAAEDAPCARVDGALLLLQPSVVLMALMDPTAASHRVTFPQRMCKWQEDRDCWIKSCDCC